MLILPIHEHSMCFQLFVSSSVSFFSVLEFSKYRSFTSLVRFIPRYFTLFEGIVNGIVFLISLSDSPLLEYESATDFWVLILYPVNLPNSFISSSSFLAESLGFSMYSLMSSANNDSFTSSFPVWMHSFQRGTVPFGSNGNWSSTSQSVWEVFVEEGQCQRLKEPAGQGSGVGVWWGTWSSPHLSFWREETYDRGSTSQPQCEAQHMCERTMDQCVGDSGSLDEAWTR